MQARARGGSRAGDAEDGAGAVWYLRVDVAHRVVLDLPEHLLGNFGRLVRHGRGGPKAPRRLLPRPASPAGPAPQRRGPGPVLQVGPAPPPSAPPPAPGRPSAGAARALRAAPSRPTPRGSAQVRRSARPTRCPSCGPRHRGHGYRTAHSRARGPWPPPSPQQEAPCSRGNAPPRQGWSGPVPGKKGTGGPPVDTRGRKGGACAPRRGGPATATTEGTGPGFGVWGAQGRSVAGCCLAGPEVTPKAQERVLSLGWRMRALGRVTSSPGARSRPVASRRRPNLLLPGPGPSKKRAPRPSLRLC